MCLKSVQRQICYIKCHSFNPKTLSFARKRDGASRKYRQIVAFNAYSASFVYAGERYVYARRVPILEKRSTPDAYT